MCTARQELSQAIKTDPVVAAQYANFDLAKAKLVKLQHDEYAYVSFRVGDGVYWTRHKVKLHEGETLITDGKHYGRTRCGNRVSKAARLPFYEHELSAETLDTPVKLAVETEAFSAGASQAPTFLENLPPMPGLSLFPSGVHLMDSTTPAVFNAAGFTPYLGSSAVRP